MKKQTKQLVGALTACVLMGAMAIGGTMAYLTDRQAEYTVVTMGNVDIEMDAQGTNERDDYTNLVPNQEVDRNWLISNIGNSDAIVFRKVDIGRVDGTVVNDDGTELQKGETELLWLKQAVDLPWGTTGDSINEGWVELEDQRIEGDRGNNTRIYAYLKVLPVDEKAPPLYEKIQVKNFTENVLKDLPDGDARKFVWDSTYAIQASEIFEDGVDLTEPNADGELSKENLNKIYEIYHNQFMATVGD